MFASKPSHIIAFSAAVCITACQTRSLLPLEGTEVVARVQVNPSTATIPVNGTVQLEAALESAAGAPVSATPEWRTADPGVATVSGQGLVRAAAAGTARIIAMRDGVSDTTMVTVTTTTPAVTLSRVELTPASTTLPVGGSQVFTTTGFWSDGATRDVAPAYSATGGTITVQGTYTAGATAGTFRVIALVSGPDALRADTALVTITAPPPPPANLAQCGNEPTGLTKVTDTPWDAAPPALPQHDAHGWGYEYTGANISVVTDATAPRSPGSVLRTTYPTGFRGGSAPANIEIRFDNARVVYVCYFVKRSADWTDNGNAGTKFFFVHTPYSGLQAYVAMNRNLTHHFAVESSGAGGPTLDYYGPQDDVGTWRKYEYLFVANTPGAADGTFTAWKNGVPFMYRAGIAYFGAGLTPAFNRVQWSPTYGGGTNPVPYTLYQDIDHWYISARP